MSQRLVLVVDKTTARFFSCKGRPPILSSLTSLSNIEGRLKDRDLATDEGGRMFDARGPNKSAFEPHSSPVEISLGRFLKEVAQEVEPFTRNGPLELILVAGPKIRGALRQELEHIKMLSIIGEINKDLSEEKPEEIARYIAREV
jgi:protein required for attachment to host cells